MDHPVLNATLTRVSDDNGSTVGTLKIGDVEFVTLEEPWRDNQRGVSCIPAGTYRVVPHGWDAGNKSGLRFKRAYRLLGTEPRTAILIHAGNTVDDIEGCILVGLTVGTLNGKRAVLQSTRAMTQMRDVVGQNEFNLVVCYAQADNSKWWQRLFNRKT